MVLFLWKPHAIPKTKSKFAYKTKKRQFKKNGLGGTNRKQNYVMTHKDYYNIRKVLLDFFSPEFERSNKPIITMSVRMLETI